MRSVFFLLLAIVLLTSCDNELVYEHNEAIENSTWSSKKAVSMEFDITDTVTLNNFYLNLRNGQNYPYSNIYLFIEMEFPNGKKAVDTLDCPLADPSGRWYGSGIGDVYDNRILYKERKQFPLAGHYKVDIYQAMRTEELKGIYDVGFRVAKAQ